MRKKSVNHLADTIFWYSLYMLPLICYLFYIKGASTFTAEASIVSFETFFMDQSWLSDYNFISNLFNGILGDEGPINIFDGNYGLFAYLSWFVSVYILHLMVDFILFIPRLTHKWMKEFTEGDD